MKILVYPKDGNPYQDLLYSHFPADFSVQYLPHVSRYQTISLIILPILLIINRLRGFRVFHLHWVYPFRFKHPHRIFRSFPAKLFMTAIFLVFLTGIKLLKYRLVWTGHDLQPHLNYFVFESRVMKLLSRVCDRIIVHSSSSIADLAKLGYSTQKVSIVPIGNYNHLYPNRIFKNQARAKLKIAPKEFVYCMFGKIERYKGVTDLLSAFISLNLPHSRLIIAGQCFDRQLQAEIEYLSRNSRKISLYLRRIPDDEIQVYLQAADVMVYPFTNITTSSSVLVSMFFKRAVICPLIGDLASFPRQSGLFYNPDQPENLARTMKSAYRQPTRLTRIAGSGYRFTLSLSWSKAARTTAGIYRNLLS